MRTPQWKNIPWECGLTRSPFSCQCSTQGSPRSGRRLRRCSVFSPYFISFIFLFISMGARNKHNPSRSNTPETCSATWLQTSITGTRMKHNSKSNSSASAGGWSRHSDETSNQTSNWISPANGRWCGVAWCWLISPGRVQACTCRALRERCAVCGGGGGSTAAWRSMPRADEEGSGPPGPLWPLSGGDG